MSDLATPPNLDEALARCPLVAILRGITPGEIDPVGDVLIEAGFLMIEVPLNSPDPFESIARLVARHGRRALVGAGTVTSPDEVRELTRVGARLAVSPHFDEAVVRASVAADLVSLPGCFTATEILAARRAGAEAVKLFPAELLGPQGVKALRAVLPGDLRLIAVGGVDVGTIPTWLAAGAAGCGLGSALYASGRSVDEIAVRARRFVEAVRREAA